MSANPTGCNPPRPERPPGRRTRRGRSQEPKRPRRPAPVITLLDPESGSEQAVWTWSWRIDPYAWQIYSRGAGEEGGFKPRQKPLDGRLRIGPLDLPDFPWGCFYIVGVDENGKWVSSRSNIVSTRQPGQGDGDPPPPPPVPAAAKTDLRYFAL